ncbi:hypothetical protein HOH87_03120 [bacterium]|nr:hypothetical protein [bacterium]
MTNLRAFVGSILLLGMLTIFSSTVHAVTTDPVQAQIQQYLQIQKSKDAKASSINQATVTPKKTSVVPTKKTSATKDATKTKTDTTQETVDVQKLELTPIQAIFYGEDRLKQFDIMISTEDTKESLQEKDLLPVYGLDVLRPKEGALIGQTGATPYRAGSAVPIGPDYLLGPGDKLMIYIWGKVEETANVELDTQGRIFMPKVGHIHLMGVRFSDATRVIEKSLEKHFVNFEVSVTIRETKSIKLFILGDVTHPGAYNVSALSTLLNVLTIAGGPTDVGSMRSIKVIRNKKTVATIDLYQYLLKGNKNQDVKLQEQDTLFIPPIGPLAMVEGVVKRPAIYELKSRSNVYDLVKLAGGFTANTFAGRLQLERVESGKGRYILDLEMGSLKGMKKKLSKLRAKNGDILRILPIRSETGRYVTVKGNVFREGTFAFNEGLTLESLIKNSEGFKPDSYLKRVEIYRYISDTQRQLISVNYDSKNGPQTVVKRWDIIQVFSTEEVYGENTVTIEGAVNNPGQYKLMRDMKVSDLVFLAQLNPFANKSNIEIVRKQVGVKPEIIAVNLADILDNPDSENDILLRSHDQVLVRLESESMRKRYIELTGEVKYPGVYLAREGERLASILKRAGGFTEDAFLKGSLFIRQSSKQREAEGQLRVIEDEKKRMIYDQTHMGSLSQDAAVAHQVVLASRQQALEQLQEKVALSTGRIVLNIVEPMERFKSTNYNIEIEDGDRLHIPVQPISIQLIGGVRNPTSILYNEGAPLHYYVNQVGGYTPYSDNPNTIIFKPNGSVELGFSKIGPGDTIYVPEKVVIAINWLQFLTNITQILSNAVTTVTLVQSLQSN